MTEIRRSCTMRRSGGGGHESRYNSEPVYHDSGLFALIFQHVLQQFLFTIAKKQKQRFMRENKF